jgi:hypothetical protein
VPQDPTLDHDGDLRVAISVQTPHAAFARLWVLPPGAAAWEQMQEVATGGPFPTEVSYAVTRDTFLGWRLAVGTTVPNSRYRVAFTLTQGGRVVEDGELVVEGVVDAGGQDVDIDHVKLR